MRDLIWCVCNSRLSELYAKVVAAYAWLKQVYTSIKYYYATTCMKDLMVKGRKVSQITLRHSVYRAWEFQNGGSAGSTVIPPVAI